MSTLKSFSYLFLAGILVFAGVKGLPQQNVTVESFGCSRPIFGKNAYECCQISMADVWGDLSSSFDACGKRKQNSNGPLVSRATEDSRDLMPENPKRMELMPESRGYNDSVRSLQENEKLQLGSPPLKKFGEAFKIAYDVYKQWFTILQDSFLILRDGNRPRGQRECYMECVFKEEGLLNNNKVNKDAVLERFKSSKVNEEFKKVMLNATETCFQKKFVPSTNSLCNSGSHAIFECVFKEVFFHCPTWPENNQYCDSLREFYKKCPENPPPPMDETTLRNNETENPETEKAA